MGDALMERLSDAGSIPARSIFGVKENACFYRHFLFFDIFAGIVREIIH